MKNSIKKIAAIVLAVALVAVMSFALVACNDDNKTVQTVRFVMPDGTPALAAARLFTDNKTIDGKNMEYDIIEANMLPTEMGGGKADVLIMPTNTGIKLIKANKADYKIVSVNVEGNLYVVGKPAGSNDSAEIKLQDLYGSAIASIGENGTPDLVFKYVVGEENIHVMDRTDDIAADKINVFYVSEASAALQELNKNENIKFALVGEPAATFPFGKQGYTSRLDVSTMYAEKSGVENFPQAAMFVKTSLASDENFMSELSAALEKSVAWVNNTANAESIEGYMTSIKSNSHFKASCIENCNIVFEKIDTQEERTNLNNYLTKIKSPLAEDNFFAYSLIK